MNLTCDQYAQKGHHFRKAADYLIHPPVKVKI